MDIHYCIDKRHNKTTACPLLGFYTAMNDTQLYHCLINGAKLECDDSNVLKSKHCNKSELMQLVKQKENNNG